MEGDAGPIQALLSFGVADSWSLQMGAVVLAWLDLRPGVHFASGMPSLSTWAGAFKIGPC